MNVSINEINRYSRLSDLSMDNPYVLSVLDRMGIPLGFGSDSVETIASRNGVDPELLLSVLQAASGVCPSGVSLDKKGIRDLILFLKTSHQQFREIDIPELRGSIISFSEGLSLKTASILLNFFDGYIEEVDEHFSYEEDIVFPYVEDLLSGRYNPYSISEFIKNHSDIERKLKDLKNILIRYIPGEGNSLSRRKILMELSNLENDLNCHNDIEDQILVHCARDLERKNKTKGK